MAHKLPGLKGGKKKAPDGYTSEGRLPEKAPLNRNPMSRADMQKLINTQKSRPRGSTGKNAKDLSAVGALEEGDDSLLLRRLAAEGPEEFVEPKATRFIDDALEAGADEETTLARMLAREAGDSADEAVKVGGALAGVEAGAKGGLAALKKAPKWLKIGGGIGGALLALQLLDAFYNNTLGQKKKDKEGLIENEAMGIDLRRALMEQGYQDEEMASDAKYAKAQSFGDQMAEGSIGLAESGVNRFVVGQQGLLNQIAIRDKPTVLDLLSGMG